MLAFSVIKIDRHRSVHRHSAEESALLQGTRPLASICSFRFSTNSAELSRQTPGIERAVSYRKQTAANCSNRPKIQKPADPFSLSSEARVGEPSARAVSLTLRHAAAKLPHRPSWGRNKLRVSGLAWMVTTIAAAAFACGCAVSHKTVVKPGDAPGKLLTATRDALVGRYNQQAEAITSLNATVSMKLTAGSAYSGVIEQYHEVNGFILTAKPANIRVIGQAPVVGKNVFDMVSNGEKFDIYIPSKNEFIVGPANLERRAEKPIENLRPQHLVDALFWPAITDQTPVLFEEAGEGASRFYILTVVRAQAPQSTVGASDAAATP